jgi:hypothetical protein
MLLNEQTCDHTITAQTTHADIKLTRTVHSHNTLNPNTPPRNEAAEPNLRFKVLVVGEVLIIDESPAGRFGVTASQKPPHNCRM